MNIAYRVAVTGILAICGFVLPFHVSAAPATTKLALVIGEPQNASRPLPTADSHAGLVAGALASQGFSVLGARNLDQALLRATLTEFEDQLQSMPAAEVVIYLGGPIVQSGRDNYFLPLDVSAQAPDDIKTKALSITTLVSDLARLTSGPKTIILDGARLQDAASIQPILPPGLAWPAAKPNQNTLIIYNQTPGLVVLEKDLPFNAFALALAEAIQAAGNLPLSMQDFVLLRTFELSEGRQAPWAMGRLDRGQSLFTSGENSKALAFDWPKKPMNSLDAVPGFASALIQRSVDAHEEYILIHVQNTMTRISRHLLAAMREERTWQEAQISTKADGLWAYLKRYPRGPHAPLAKEKLIALGQPISPPEDASILGLQTPAPTLEETTILMSNPLFRLDDTNAELKETAAQIRALLPKMTGKDREPAKLDAAAGPYSLPIWPNASGLSGQIQMPKAVQNQAALPIITDLTTEKPAATTVPVPPKRGNAAQPPKKIGTQPAATPDAVTPDAPAAPARTPKPALPIIPKSFGEIFDEPSGTDIKPGFAP